jgi:hypothetical protein
LTKAMMGPPEQPVHNNADAKDLPMAPKGCAN